MKQTKEAHKYAKALLRNVGIDEVEKTIRELAVMNDLIIKSKELKNFLVNPQFTVDERTKVIQLIAQKMSISQYAVKLVLHLSEVGLILTLSDIIRIATNIYLERKKKAKAVVMTPVEIGKERQSIIKSSLKKLTDRDVDIDYVVDPSLLGGILVKIGSTMYDTSIRSQLRLLKDELIKG